MKYIKLNVSSANLSRKAKNLPYQFATLCKWETGCGDQYRWPGEYIGEILKKHHIGKAEFARRVSKLLEDKYGTVGVSAAMIGHYVNGYTYNKTRTYKDADTAMLALDDARVYNPKAFIEIVVRGNSTKYRLKMPEWHGVCPKMDIFNGCADVIAEIDGDAGSTVRMAGRAYYAMAAKNTKKKAA